MRRPGSLPPELAERPAFGVLHALELGTSRRRLDASDLRTPFRGARLRVDVPPDVLTLAAAYATRMPRTQFFSHTTAAMLNGVPLPYALESDTRLHVSVFAGDPQPRVRGVIGHQLERGRTATVQTSTMRMTDAATTWCQLATLLEVEDLVAVGDFLVTGREQLGGRPAAATIDTLRAAVSMRHGGAGVARLRDALVHVRRGPLSRRETLLRLRLVRRGLPEPVVAYRVREPLLAPFEPTVDLAYPGARIAIEYEGDHHRTPEQFRRDIARYERLHDAGWVVLRVTARDVPDGEGRISPVLVERVATLLRQRGRL
jgi:hypothetical protein